MLTIATLPLLIVLSNGDVSLKEHISDMWTALATYKPSSDNFHALCRLVVTRCHRKLYTRIFLDQKTWNVHVAQKLCDWTPNANEIPKTRSGWFDAPPWFALVSIPADKGLRMRKEGPADNQITQLEFSSETVGFWAWLLGDLILTLEFHAEEVRRLDKEKNRLGFKEAVSDVSDYCNVLNSYVHWKPDIVKILLTETTLGSVFHLPPTVYVEGVLLFCFRISLCDQILYTQVVRTVRMKVNFSLVMVSYD